jgi:peptide/nickel transport system ATP-binding protein
LNRRELHRLRYAHLAYVGQDPGAALNPTMRVRTLLTEVAADRSRDAVEALLAQVSLRTDHLRRRPAELSGGEQRRVAIARALGRQVCILLIDEPFAGLDPALRDGIAALLRSLADDRGLAVAVSGHDTMTLGNLADDVVELGRLGRRSAVTSNRRPDERAASAVHTSTDSGRAALSARSLAATVDRGRRQLVHGVDLEVAAGEATALIGVSSAGKTTVARVMAGLHAGGVGFIALHGTPLALHAARRTIDQRRRIGWVPQDPMSTLNPSRTIGATLARPLARHRIAPARERAVRVAELLAQVRLPADTAGRYPHELSGGQRQRVAIARALATDPDVLICDEITSALDAATAGAIMEVLDEARIRRGLGLLLITHQLHLVRAHCSTVTVLDRGTVAEAGPAETLFTDPRHAAMKHLLAADPGPG